MKAIFSLIVRVLNPEFTGCWRSKIKMFCFNCIIDSFVSSYKLHYTHVSQMCAHKVMGHKSQLSEVIAISKWQFVYVCMPFQRWPAIFVLPKVLRVLSLFPHPYKSLKWLHSDCRGSRTLIWILPYIFSLVHIYKNLIQYYTYDIN